MTHEDRLKMADLLGELKAYRDIAAEKRIYSGGYRGEDWERIHPRLRDTEERWDTFVTLHSVEMADEIVALWHAKRNPGFDS